MRIFRRRAVRLAGAAGDQARQPRSRAVWLDEQRPAGESGAMIWATWRFWWLQGHASELGQFTEKIWPAVRTWRRTIARSPERIGFVSLASGDMTTAETLFGQSSLVSDRARTCWGGAWRCRSGSRAEPTRQDYQRCQRTARADPPPAETRGERGVLAGASACSTAGRRSQRRTSRPDPPQQRAARRAAGTSPAASARRATHRTGSHLVSYTTGAQQPGARGDLDGAWRSEKKGSRSRLIPGTSEHRLLP